MSGANVQEKTIGEVEKITNISKRELKYFIEQDIMRPFRKSESGYWLYSEDDIRRVRLAAMCRDLGFPVRHIRANLADPTLRWTKELEQQTARLAEELNQVQNRFIHAQSLQRLGVWDAVDTYFEGKDAALAAK